MSLSFNIWNSPSTQEESSVSDSSMLDCGQGQRCSVLPVLVGARAEDGVQVLPVEGAVERVQVRLRPGVVERHHPHLVVQEDPDLLRGSLDLQGDPVGGQGLHLTFLQPEAPEPALRAQPDLALTSGGRASHPQGPGCLTAHVHLPVVAAGRHSLAAQDKEGRAEAAGAVRAVGAAVLLVAHLAPVLGHGQVALGGDRVQEHFICKKWVTIEQGT